MDREPRPPFTEDELNEKLRALLQMRERGADEKDYENARGELIVRGNFDTIKEVEEALDEREQGGEME